ncbi:DUF4292 domain-containing protein [bacterium]|nr:DUF4292 domain-containing protein [bacterium]
MLKKFLFFSILIFVYACSPKIQISRNDTEEKVIRLVNTNHDKLKTFMAQSSISIENQSFSQSVNTETVLNFPDSLFVNVKNVLVGSFAKVFASQKNFMAYIKLKNELFSGKTSQATIGDFFGVEMEFNELISVVTGTEKFSVEDVAGIKQFSFEDENYFFVIEKKELIKNVWVDPKSYTITKVQFVDLKTNNVLLERIYTNFKKTDGIFLPNSIKVKNLAKEQFLVINHRTKKANKKLSSKVFKLNYPESVKKVTYISRENYGS